MNREKYKRIIKKMSKKGINDANISRVLGVSTTVVKYILCRPGYRPTERLQKKIIDNLTDFLSVFSK